MMALKTVFHDRLNYDSWVKEVYTRNSTSIYRILHSMILKRMQTNAFTHTESVNYLINRVG